jgi:hypothetical protein
LTVPKTLASNAEDEVGPRLKKEYVESLTGKKGWL